MLIYIPLIQLLVQRRNCFYEKSKSVSCEYDRLNGWNSTLQAAWYIRHVRITWFLWTKPTIWLLILSFTQSIFRACSMLYPYEGYRSVTPLDAPWVFCSYLTGWLSNRTISIKFSIRQYDIVSNSIPVRYLSIKGDITRALSSHDFTKNPDLPQQQHHFQYQVDTW